MKILILDDYGETLYEQEDPGYLHLPIIMDGKDDFSCEDDDCEDPRCIERREECEEFLRKWVKSGVELGLFYHYRSSQEANSDEADLNDFEKLPNIRVPRKVKLASFTRYELVFTTGERVNFHQPHLNCYSSPQVMFSAGKWDASLVPWRESHEKKSAKTAG